jgi:hypothetical protein
LKYFNEYIRLYRYLHDPILFKEKRDKVTEDILFFLETYVNLVGVQVERLRKDEHEMMEACKLPELYSMEKRVAFSKHTGDIHFYIICIDKVIKLAFELANQFDDECLKEIVKKYEEITLFRKARNNLEHLDEKLIKTDWFRKDMGATINYKLNVNGTEIDYSNNVVEKVHALYEELIVRIDLIIEPRKAQIDELWARFS